MPLLVVSIMSQLVLAGGMIPVTGRVVLNQLSWVTPARWGYAASASTIDLPDLVPGQADADQRRHWQHSKHILLLDMGMLGRAVAVLRRLRAVEHPAQALSVTVRAVQAQSVRSGERQRLRDVDPRAASATRSSTATGPRSRHAGRRRPAGCPMVRAPVRSAPRSTALRRSASTRLVSRSRHPLRSTPRRSLPPSTASVKSTSSSVSGRSRHRSNTEPSMLHCEKCCATALFSLNLQLRNADPRCSDSARLTPLKSHSVNTTRSVLQPAQVLVVAEITADEFAIDPLLQRGQLAVRLCQRVFADRDQRVGRRPAIPGIDVDHRDVRGQRQRLAHLGHRIPWRAVEFVDRDEERQVAVLEEVDRGEAVLQTPAVHQDDRADRAADQVVPHEPESALARGTEQVEHQILVQGDPAEVHRHRGGPLVRGGLEHVDAGRGVGDHRLGSQRHDLRNRADERRFAGAEPARDDDLRRGGVARSCGGPHQSARKATQRPSYQFVAFIAGRPFGQRPVHSKVARQSPDRRPTRG